MKHRALIIAVWLLCGHLAWAEEGWRLDLAHFDAVGGALTVSADGSAALSDHCIGQLIADADSAGAAWPQGDGRPGAGDRLLIAADDRAQELVSFRVNGEAYFGAAGFFRVTLERHAGDLPLQRIFLRVWNHLDFAEATGYWDSPPFRVLGGPQQVSFRRDEWLFHALERITERGPDDSPANSDDDPARADDARLLTAWPNPFNSTARVRLALGQPGHVRLRVFDVQGRVISTLIEGALPAGEHVLMVDGATWPTGLYFLAAELGGRQSVVQRLLLVR